MGASVALKTTVPDAPIFIAAVTISPVPVAPGIFAMPSWVRVVAMASMSLIWFWLAATANVLTPAITDAGRVLLQANEMAMSCENVAAGVIENTIDWLALAA